MQKATNITIPIPEKVSFNKMYAGFHWSKRKRLADLYKQYLLEFRRKSPIDEPVEISYVFTCKRPLDSSNCFLMVKLLEDALIHNNIIQDDSPEYVTGSCVYSQKGDTDTVQITIS